MSQSNFQREAFILAYSSRGLVHSGGEAWQETSMVEELRDHIRTANRKQTVSAGSGVGL